MIDASGAWWHGNAKVNSNYVGYGAPVFAAASGAVVSVLNDVPENVPTEPPQNITIENAAGNHVIVDIGGDRFVTYAHLQPGSVPVRKGDRIHRGQYLGKVGNSGSSAGPHLHFQVSDSASNGAATSSGKPYVMSSFELVGRLLNEEAWLSLTTVVPAEIGPAAPPPTERRLQLPIVADIVVFP
jgi:murein DD-endopeptidase MepM/ murein hydrolase activator NlpD